MDRYREALVMGIVTAIAAFAALTLIDGPTLAALVSAIVAGCVAFGVTTYQVRRRR